MTIRRRKQLMLAAAAMMVLAVALGLYDLVKHGWRAATGVWTGLFFLALIASWWGQLSKLEAEHGPDYDEPTAVPGRRAMIVLGAVVIVIAVGVLSLPLARR